MTQSQTITVAAVALVAVVAVGGGLAYAAKDAQEGDMLYGLHASLYGDDTDGDAQSDLDAARNAYDEAAALKANGQLTASEQARIGATYSARINALMDRIARLEADGDAQAAAELRTNLRAIMRDANHVFPSSVSSSSAMTSSDASVSSGMSVSAGASASGDVDASASSASNDMTGASSSIFVQPSSSVTSA
jgi:hypothetical protein